MIESFSGEYRWLSNFWPAEVVSKSGVVFRDVETAYQWAKFAGVEPEIAEEIASARSPGEAKRLAHRYAGQEKERIDWPGIKERVMEALLRQKFRRGSELAKKLVATGDRELVEGNSWGDRFWGVCNGTGDNRLGKLLMKLRAELQQ